MRSTAEAEDAAESSAMLACSALEHWRWAVRGRFLTASSDEARTALRGLAGTSACVSTRLTTTMPPQTVSTY
jgi:hypothetical protein